MKILIPILLTLNTFSGGLCGMDNLLGSKLRESFASCQSSRSSSGFDFFGLFNRVEPQFKLKNKQECIEHMNALQLEYEDSNVLLKEAIYSRTLIHPQLEAEGIAKLESYHKPYHLGLPKFTYTNKGQQVTAYNSLETSIHLHEACAQDVRVLGVQKTTLKIKGKNKECRQTKMSLYDDTIYTYHCIGDRQAYMSFGESPIINK